MSTWTVTATNDTNMTAYMAYRLAQDGIVLTLDQAVAELLLKAGIPHDAGSTSFNSPGIKTHGNYFHIL